MNYNSIKWGNQYGENMNIDLTQLQTANSVSESDHEMSQIKSMVKLSDDSFVIVGKFKYIYLKKGTDKYRLEVNGIVKFNSDGTINESFLKFDNTNKLYWNGFNSPKLPYHFVTEVLFDYYFKEIKPSVNDIVAKGGYLYVCGGFSTYRGLAISNNKTESEAYEYQGPEVDVMMYGRNSLIKISQTSGDIDINTRFVFDINSIQNELNLVDFVQTGPNFGQKVIDNRCVINTIVEYDSDNILVGGSFMDIRLCKTTGDVNSKKSSLMKFNTSTNTFSNLWDCLYYKLNIYGRDFIFISKGIHVDMGYKLIPDRQNHSPNNISTYEDINNFSSENDFVMRYDKNNKEIKKILVIEEQTGVKSIFVVGNFNCYLDGSKKHWLNKIMKFNGSGDLDPNFLVNHSATNYTYTHNDQSPINYIDADKNTGFGFSSLQVGLSDVSKGINVYVSDIKMVDNYGNRPMFDDNGNCVTSGGRYVAYDDELLIDPDAYKLYNLYKYERSYVSDIVYHNNTILVCGKFNHYKNKDGDYKNLKNIIRLNLNGSVDTTFDTSNNIDLDNFYSIDSIKIVNNGNNILIGGRPKYQGVLNVLQAGETNNVFLKLKSNGDNVNGSDNNLKFRYYSINDDTYSTFDARIPFINKIF